MCGARESRKRSPHTLRHCFATLVANGTNLQSVREMLGHADISQHSYINVNQEQIREKKAHPLG
ncbi:MAG: tyrosine-type recombinase/integrase [Gallintestinimicrobium sp.]